MELKYREELLALSPKVTNTRISRWQARSTVRWIPVGPNKPLCSEYDLPAKMVESEETASVGQIHKASCLLHSLVCFVLF